MYKSLRPGCAINEDQALPIGAFDNLKLGLHPALVGMKSLWDAGQVAIILGVGYPNPNFSHFESMEIMQSADPSGDNPTGWLGRWLDVSGSSPTRALSIGPNLPQVFAGARQQASTIADSTNPGDQQPGGDGVFISSYRDVEHVFKRETRARGRNRPDRHEHARRRRQGGGGAQLPETPQFPERRSTPATSATSSTSWPS